MRRPNNNQQHDAEVPIHSVACSNRDFDFFYDGLEFGRLVVQRCEGCQTLRNPPAPSCGDCGSFDWSPVPLSGAGTVYSYVVHHHPPLPGFETPHPVVLVEMVEGVRFVGALDREDLADLAIGAPVETWFVRRENVAIFEFRLRKERSDG